MQFSPLYFVGLNAGLNTFHYPHTHYPPSQVKSQLFQLDKYASLLKVKLFCMYLISSSSGGESPLSLDGVANLQALFSFFGSCLVKVGVPRTPTSTA